MDRRIGSCSTFLQIIIKDARPWEPCGGGSGSVGPGGARGAPQKDARGRPWGAKDGQGGRVWGPVGPEGGPKVQTRAWDWPGTWDPQGGGLGHGPN